MRYVGETANKKEFQTDKKMVVLGITNWTTVANKEELILNEVCHLIRLSEFVEYFFLNFIGLQWTC